MEKDKIEKTEKKKPPAQYFGNNYQRTKELAKLYFIASDIEDDSKGNFLIGCFYGEYLDRHQKVHEIDKTFFDKTEYINFISHIPPDNNRLIYFNTSYDLGIIENTKIVKQRLTAKGRFITARTYNELQIIDLANHFAMGTKLSDLMETINMKKDRTTLKEDQERRAGIVNKLWTDRCRNDTKATWILAIKTQKWYNEIGINMPLTIGTAALKIFDLNHFTHKWNRKQNKAWINEKEKAAYYGGRTELFYNEECIIESSDINSAYVAAMLDNLFPDPNSATWVHKKEVTIDKLKELMGHKDNKGIQSHFQTVEDSNNAEDYTKCKQGIAEVTIKMPKTKYPPLPFYDEKRGKLLFPVGTFRGTYCFPEIELAIKEGAEILKVHLIIYYKKSFPYFKTYAKWIWEEREKHPKDTDPFYNKMIKLLGNSLYGKWAQLNGKEQNIRLEDFQGWYTDPENKDIINEVKIKFTEEYAIITGGKGEFSTHSFPVLSAYITSFVRVKLYNELKKHNTVYVDTDSIKYIGKKDEIPDSSELGGFGFEYTAKFRGRAPKLYKIAIQDPKTLVFGEWKWTAKSIPKRAFKPEEWDLTSKVEILDTGISAEFDAPNKWGESCRYNKKHSSWEIHKKFLAFKDNKRIWNKDGTSEAITLEAQNYLKTLLTLEEALPLDYCETWYMYDRLSSYFGLVEPNLITTLDNNYFRTNLFQINKVYDKPERHFLGGFEAIGNKIILHDEAFAKVAIHEYLHYLYNYLGLAKKGFGYQEVWVIDMTSQVNYKNLSNFINKIDNKCEGMQPKREQTLFDYFTEEVLTESPLSETNQEEWIEKCREILIP